MGKRISIILIALGVVFGLSGVRSLLKDHGYRKSSVVVKADVIQADVKDIRTQYGNYYLKPTHQITQQLAFLRDGSLDTMTLESQFLMYTEGKTTTNPNPIPTAEELMKQPKYIRYVPESKKEDTAFPDRIDINTDGEYEAQNNWSPFFQMLICFVAGGILYLLSR